ncbi:MAG: hypothetical protein K9N23_12650, partial [Akkermansiaceae bacterium]|nr:hypothetical protein [Akkermansiaceae bacterium]
LAPTSGAAFVYPIPPPAPAQEIEVYTGTDPNLTEAPANVTRQLGEAWLHQQQAWPVTVFNDGAATLQVTAAELLPGAGDGITVNPIGGIFGQLSVFPGETAVITVRTDFETPGLRACTLRISSNDSDEATYDLPLAFDPRPQPAPPGFRVQREGGAVVLRYPQQPGFFTYQVQRSLLLDGWEDLGFLQAEFDPESNGILMVFRDQNPPPGRAFYRLKIQ